jgi:hypothetical protein
VPVLFKKKKKEKKMKKKFIVLILMMIALMFSSVQKTYAFDIQSIDGDVTPSEIYVGLYHIVKTSPIVIDKEDLMIYINSPISYIINQQGAGYSSIQFYNKVGDAFEGSINLGNYFDIIHGEIQNGVAIIDLSELPFYDVSKNYQIRFSIFFTSYDIVTAQAFSSYEFGLFLFKTQLANIFKENNLYYESGKKDGFDLGYLRGMNDYKYCDIETQTCYTATEWGNYMYDLALSESDFSWIQILWSVFVLPFQIFSIDLMPGTGLYVGYFALITLVIGVLTFFFMFKGKK